MNKMLVLVALSIFSISMVACGGSGSGSGGGSGDNCSSWGEAELIETDNAGYAKFPQVAVDDSGNAIAVWSQFDGTRLNILANRYYAATGLWGTAELIETDEGPAGKPWVAVDGSGNAIAVWRQSDGTLYNVWANRYDAATGLWGTAELIETDDAGDAGYEPRVAVDDSGNAIAVWSQADGGTYNIWANCYNAATGLWGEAELIEDGAGPTSEARVGIDDSGNAIAVWSQADGGTYNIWANRYDAATGLWGEAELIETGDAAGSPEVAVDGNGNAIAVWGQSDGIASYNVWAKRYDAATGLWGEVELIETDGAGHAPYPQVAVDGGGNAIAVWQQFDGARDNIWANRYDAASGWGEAELIATSDAGNAQYPRVAVDGGGNAIAVWRQSDGTLYNVWANRYDAASGWGEAELIETDDAGNAQYPQVAVDGGGNAIAVWQQSDGTRTNIWANRYE
jgi:hypothetical protein